MTHVALGASITVVAIGAAILSSSRAVAAATGAQDPVSTPTGTADSPRERIAETTSSSDARAAGDADDAVTTTI